MERGDGHGDFVMRIVRRLAHAVATIAGICLVVIVDARAQVQPFPNKPIRLVLPYTPGSPNDVLARLIAPHLSDRLGQPLVVENRPGGGTMLGARAVMSAEPDGHTLLLTNTPTHVIAPLIGKSPTFDPLHDFTPVATIASTFLMLVVSAPLPVRTVTELIDHARANPGRLNIGFGQGTLPHLASELLKSAAGADIASIPYRGGAQAVTDLLGGRIHMNLGAPVTLMPHVRGGNLRALAVTNATRGADLPDIPTMTESGLPSVTTVTYYGLLGPAGLPANVAERISHEVNELLKSPEVIASLRKTGFGPKGGSSGDFTALMIEQSQKWTPVVRSIGFQME